MTANLMNEILQLSIPERLELIENIWESIEAAPDAIELTDAQRQELDRRLELHRQNPTSSSTWEVVKQRLNEKLLSTLLKKNAEQLQKWLADIWNNKKTVPDNFNWLGLAEVTAAEACDRAERAPSSRLKFAEISTSIYDFLAENEKNDSIKESLLYSSMSLRIFTIVTFEKIPNHPVLDLERVFQWFFKSLEYSFDEVENKILFWQEFFQSSKAGASSKTLSPLELEELRNLRHIKSRLAILQYLADIKPNYLNREVQKWLSIKQNLP